MWLKTLLSLAAASSLAAALDCEKLTSLKLPDTSITLAAEVKAADALPSARGGKLTAPAPFCRVALLIQPTPVSHINVEVWLPPAANWNGKFLGTGNGGAAGVVALQAMLPGLQKGYATANTDMGTNTAGLDFSFGIGHPEMVEDFAYRSTHLMTVMSKQIIRAYYGREAKYSYFTGCSTGGHQALTEAQRFPDDYNGIVAGAPANNRTHLHVVGRWNYMVTHDDPEAYFPPDKLPMVHKAILAACDGLDGVVDGVIDDPRRCNFDPSTLVCDGPNCLTAKQANALKKVFAGPRNPRTGELIFPGMYPGSEMNPPGLPSLLANPPGTTQPAARDLVMWAPSYKGPGFDFDQDQKTLDEEVGPIVNDVRADLSPFQKHGGKLLFYSGWADPLIPAGEVVRYYEKVEATMGGPQSTQLFTRLFMVPGMGHCAGGTGPNRFDALSALEPWVEKNVAPEKIVASQVSGGVTERTRPLCPYPQVARWNGTGSTNDAANFVCSR